MNRFEHRLAFGKVAESKIANWLRHVVGRTVMPVYEIELNTGKGPQIFAPECGYVAPDLFIPNGKDGAFWAEAKHKSVFTWYRIKERWVTGIDLHHYDDYLAVRERYGWPLWLVFLHESDVPSEEDQRWLCPDSCPTGLYGGEILELSECESHRSPNWGQHGMVYWAHENLRLLAPLDTVIPCGASHG